MLRKHKQLRPGWHAGPLVVLVFLGSILLALVKGVRKQ